MNNKGIRHMTMKKGIRSGAILLGVLSLSLMLTWGLTRGDSRVIQTIAGSGEQGFTPNGALALEAKLGTLQGLAVDGAGNVYVAEVSNQDVRRIDPTGRISQVAGLGPEGSGYNGDNHAANQAKLATPTGVALGDDGSLYIADNGNHRVRKVSSQGIITTVAGTGEQGLLGEGDGGPATAAKLANPASLALDSAGNLYIGEASSFRVRRVDRATGIITTIAGGQYGYAGDGGLATAAAFRSMSGLAVSPSGDVFVADANNHRVRRISTAGTITTVAGNGVFNILSIEELGDGGAATSAAIRFPYSVAFDRSGNFYIAEFGSNRVRRVDTNGIITTVAGSGHPTQPGSSGDGGPADQAKLNRPSAVAVDSSGNVYVSDSANYRVRKVNAQ